MVPERESRPELELEQVCTVAEPELELVRKSELHQPAWRMPESGLLLELTQWGSSAVLGQRSGRTQCTVAAGQEWRSVSGKVQCIAVLGTELALPVGLVLGQEQDCTAAVLELARDCIAVGLAPERESQPELGLACTVVGPAPELGQQMGRSCTEAAVVLARGSQLKSVPGQLVPTGWPARTDGWDCSTAEAQLGPGRVGSGDRGSVPVPELGSTMGAELPSALECSAGADAELVPKPVPVPGCKELVGVEPGPVRTAESCIAPERLVLDRTVA